MAGAIFQAKKNEDLSKKMLAFALCILYNLNVAHFVQRIYLTD